MPLRAACRARTRQTVAPVSNVTKQIPTLTHAAPRLETRWRGMGQGAVRGAGVNMTFVHNSTGRGRISTAGERRSGNSSPHEYYTTQAAAFLEAPSAPSRCRRIRIANGQVKKRTNHKRRGRVGHRKNN